MFGDRSQPVKRGWRLGTPLPVTALPLPLTALPLDCPARPLDCPAWSLSLRPARSARRPAPTGPEEGPAISAPPGHAPRAGAGKAAATAGPCDRRDRTRPRCRGLLRRRLRRRPPGPTDTPCSSRQVAPPDSGRCRAGQDDPFSAGILSATPPFAPPPHGGSLQIAPHPLPGSLQIAPHPLPGPLAPGVLWGRTVVVSSRSVRAGRPVCTAAWGTRRPATPPSTAAPPPPPSPRVRGGHSATRMIIARRAGDFSQRAPARQD